MSTNYYVKPRNLQTIVNDVQNKVGEIAENIHNCSLEKVEDKLEEIRQILDMAIEGTYLGKQTGGWAFLFNGIAFRSWQEWRREIEQKDLIILNECGQVFELSLFELMIEERKMWNGEPSRHNSYGDSWIDANGFDFCSEKIC